MPRGSTVTSGVPSRRVGANTLWALLIGLLIVTSAVRIIVAAPDEPQAFDAQLYVTYAENLATSGVYGIEDERSMGSAPLLSGVLAAAMRIDPRHSDLRAGVGGSDRRAIRQVNALFVIVLLTGSAASVLLVVKDRRRALVAAAVTVALIHLFFLENPEVGTATMQELPTAGLMAWANVTALLLVRDRRLRWAAALGAIGGLLALTRAALLYIFPVFAVLLLMILTGMTLRRRATFLAVTMLAFSMAAGPWITRNAVVFGEFSISDAGGHVLLTRDVKNGMTSHQLRGAWVHYSPEPVRAPLARILAIDLEDFEGDGPLRPLVRSIIDPVTGDDLDILDRRSLYRQATDQHNAWTEEGVAQGLSEFDARIAADRRALATVSENVRERPFRFLRTTPVFLYRSSWPMNDSTLWDSGGVSLPRITMGALNVFGMLTVLAFGALGLFRRRPVLFALGGLGTGLVAYHALLTHALPRYSRPAVALMLVGVVLVGEHLLAANASRHRRRVNG